jgi:hypothetical protein
MLMAKVTTRTRTFALAAALLCTVGSAAAAPPPRLPTAEQQGEVDRLTAEHRARMQQHDYGSASASARPRSSALREVQLELLAQSKYAHPYFWASLVPAGENAPIKD